MQKHRKKPQSPPIKPTVAAPPPAFAPAPVVAPVEETKKRVVTFHLDQSDYEKLVKLASLSYRTHSAYIRSFICTEYDNLPADKK